MTLQAYALNGHLSTAANGGPQSINLLDTLLEEGRAQLQIAKEEPLGLDDLLSGLIGESLQEKKNKDRLKEARKQARNTALPGSTIRTLRSEIRELEYKAEWRQVADVIWIKRCVCLQCGSETPQFAGYFRKSHSRISKAYRYTALSAEVESDLPREMKTEMTTVDMCADCIPQILMEDGWMTAELLQAEEADKPSFGDEPEDEELLAEEAEEEPVPFEGQTGNQIEFEEDLDPPYQE